MTGPRELSLIAAAIASSTGESSTISRIDSTRSNVRLIA